MLPGDASEQLIKQIAVHNTDCFKNIDVVVFSHHGSNRANELTLIDKIIECQSTSRRKSTTRTGSMRPLLGIISSQTSATSNIPKYFSSTGTTFIQKMAPLGTAFPITQRGTWQGAHYCCLHLITFYDTSISMDYIAPSITEDGKSIIPVFSTGDLAMDLFYKIEIPAGDASITMKNEAGAILYQTQTTNPSMPTQADATEFLIQAIAAIMPKVENEGQKLIPHIKTLTRLLPPVEDLEGPANPLTLHEQIDAFTGIKQSNYLGLITILERLQNLQ